jgi:hypothetical protein
MQFHTLINNGTGYYNINGDFVYNSSYIIQQVCAQWHNYVLNIAALLVVINVLTLSFVIFLYSNGDINKRIFKEKGKPESGISAMLMLNFFAWASLLFSTIVVLLLMKSG